MMDGYYGAPRQPPTLPKINSIERTPTVPEVSFYGPPCQNLNSDTSLFKKHVRFKNLSPQQCFGKENVPQTLKVVPDLNGKTFKQIYMANVPDRHLDLSIFEPAQNEPKFSPAPVCRKTMSDSSSIQNTRMKNLENNSPKLTYRESDFYSKKYTQPIDKVKTPPKCMEICTQTDQNTQVATTSDEPTIKDLFRIIQQQNEQIMLLQRQVNNLKTSVRQPEIDSVPFDDKLTNSPTKKSLFSFDVKATSFEFSFRPQHKFRRQNEPKIQEILECDNAENPVNSLQLNESLNIRDSYMSDVPSIDIKMDEYQSSDDEQEPQVNIGLTFYRDLMDQVNNVLKKVQKESECLPPSVRQEVAGQTMKVVEQTTLQHLKKMGVNLPPIQESSETTDNYDKSDISYAVQQLLMKYLPEDKLTRAINKPEVPRMKEKIKPSNNEFSFATLQYMRKYNLIDNKKIPREKKVPEMTPRILDVTALKLQPKLL